MFSVPGLVSFKFKPLVISLETNTERTVLIRTSISIQHFFTFHPCSLRVNCEKNVQQTRMLGLSKMCNCLFHANFQALRRKCFCSGSHNVKHSCFMSLFSVQYQSQFGMNVVISLATQKVKQLFQSRVFRMKRFSVHCNSEGITATVKPSV